MMIGWEVSSDFKALSHPSGAAAFRVWGMSITSHQHGFMWLQHSSQKSCDSGQKGLTEPGISAQDN